MARSKKPPRQDTPAEGPAGPQGALLRADGTTGIAAPFNTPQQPGDLRSAIVSRLPAPESPRAFELLAARPTSLVGLSQADRDLVVISAVADDCGNEHVVSRLGDRVWNLASEVKAKNKSAVALQIVWPDDLPKALVDDAKAALYCFMRRGRTNERKPSAGYVLTVGNNAVIALRELASMGLRDFGAVRALYLSDYIAELRGLTRADAPAKGRRKRGMQPLSVFHRLYIIDLVWHFAMDVIQPLREHPWRGESLFNACGCGDDDNDEAGETSKTPVIPRDVQRKLFEYCENVLDGAEALLQARDAGMVGYSSYGLREVRNAVLYLAQINSGMRNSECTWVTNKCWRSEVLKGVTYHWVRTKEIKTTGGKIVDFLVPPELFRALEILQRYAEPLQERLADEARWLKLQLDAGADGDGKLANGMTVPEAVGRLNHVREIGCHMFLSINTLRSDHLGSGRVEVMTQNNCSAQLKVLAIDAGTDWSLANHQCRRTFAYNVANSKLGRMGLVFLRWQLKHASLSWTQLYASNPRQDRALYQEMEEEQIAARAELMDGWMQADTPLAGGAGKKILEARARPAKNMEEVLRHTAASVDIAFTGHGMCLGRQSCGGQGLYDPSYCGPCSQSVIDESQAPTWQMIHIDNLRLASLGDCGPAVAQKAQRSIQRSEQVLRDLGVPLPTHEQVEAYVKTGATLS